MLLSSEEPVVRQFLNAQTIGPIGMSEEKDADDLAAEAGQELPPLPPIPLQQEPSNGIPRRSQRPPGEWCKENGVTPSSRVVPGEHDHEHGGLTDVLDQHLALPRARRHRRQPVRLRPRRRPAGCSAGRSRPASSSKQAWFIASVTIIPTALVAIPFGAVIALQVGGLIKQFGAPVVRRLGVGAGRRPRGGPIADLAADRRCGGSAIAADLGARKIREELDAMMVLGIDPIQRLVVPRVLPACSSRSSSTGWSASSASAGGYVFNVVLQDGHAGAYLASFTALAQLPDLWQGMAKASSSAWSRRSSPATRA
jgi:ABC-type transporter Mla maintaining outer membrane lipid asymmetry permease subunit MlaE